MGTEGGGRQRLSITSPEHRDMRQALLGRVEEIREILASCADDSEGKGTLAAPAVKAMRKADLFQLRVPTELGGVEADLLTQLEVLEALTYIDSASGWCAMVGSASVAALGAFLTEAGVERVFPGGHVPLVASSFYPAGTAVPENDGYRINGRWRFASGIRHADWVWAGAKITGNENGSISAGGQSDIIYVVLPAEDIHIHDNWNAVGLRGTGSCDFSVIDVHVATELAMNWNPAAPEPLRGGPLYRLPSLAFVGHEHVAFAAGLARRVLDELVKMATTRSGQFRPVALSKRKVFHRFMGESDLKLRSARSLAIVLFEDVWQKVCTGESITLASQAELRAIATHMTDLAADIIAQSFRYGGAGTLLQPNIFERSLRDMNAAAQHILVSDSAYENHGMFQLGLPEADPMN